MHGAHTILNLLKTTHNVVVSDEEHLGDQVDGDAEMLPREHLHLEGYRLRHDAAAADDVDHLLLRYEFWNQRNKW